MKKLIFILPFLIIALSCRGQSWFPNGFWVGDSTISGSQIILVDSITLSASDTAIWSGGVKIGIGATAGGGGGVYNSGSGITIDGSYNIDLGGALDAATIISGTETNYFELKMADASDRSVKFVFRPADALSMRAYSGDDYTGDSGFVSVDSTTVIMAQYDGAAEKSIKIDTVDATGINVRDDDAGVGMVYYGDYSLGFTTRSITDKGYQDLHLGGQTLNSTIYSPGADEHGDVLTWDNTNSEFEMTDVVSVGSAAGMMIVTCDTILYSNTTIDTAVVLPVGAVVWDIQVYIKTAFTGTGTDLLDVGISGSGERYEADLDLSTGSKWYGLDNVADRMTATTNIIYQYFDSNADAGAGEAYIYVHYSIH
jgi:hypothetical protein